MQRVPIVCLLLAWFLGCAGLESKQRSFFAKAGMTVGTPARNAAGSVFIPITYETRQVHSAQWLHDVAWLEVAGEILIAAVFSVPPGEREPGAYAGAITLQKPRRNAYQLRYRDPDGKTFHVGDVQLPPT